MSIKVKQFILRIVYGLSIPLVSLVHIYLNRERGNERDLSTFIDGIIPFNAWFAIPYLYWFLYIFLVVVYFAIVDYKSYFRLLSSIVAGMSTSFLFFIFLPSEMIRAEDGMSGSGFLSYLMGLIYGNDNPYNCFPSIHVLNAFLATAFICRLHKGVFMRTFAILSCILISLSTMFVKQHYALDVLAALLIGWGMYVLFSADHKWNKGYIRRFTDFIIPAKVRAGSAEAE
jgi:membrane-associated phospholipid phosphatase